MRLTVMLGAAALWRASDWIQEVYENLGRLYGCAVTVVKDAR